MKKVNCISLALGLMLLMLQAAYATPVTTTFSAKVNSIQNNGSLTTYLSIGDIISGSFNYDNEGQNAHLYDSTGTINQGDMISPNHSFFNDIISYSFSSNLLEVFNHADTSGNYNYLEKTARHYNPIDVTVISYFLGNTYLYVNIYDMLNSPVIHLQQGSAYNINTNQYTEYVNYALSDLIVMTNSSAPVPEPSTMLLLGGGLGAIAFWRRRSSKK